MTLISKWHPRLQINPPKAISVAHDQEIGGYSGSCSCTDHAGGHREFLQGLHWAKSSRGAKGVTLQSSPEVGEVESWWFDDLPKLGGLILLRWSFFLKIKPWFPEHQILRPKRRSFILLLLVTGGSTWIWNKQRIHRWNFVAPWRCEVKSRVEDMLRRTWITLKKLLWSHLYFV